MKANSFKGFERFFSPVAMTLATVVLLTMSLASCHHCGSDGDAGKSDSAAQVVGSQIFADYYKYYDASTLAQHGDDFNDNVDDNYADDPAAPASSASDQDTDGTTAVPADKVRGNADEAEKLIGLFNSMDTDDMAGVIEQLKEVYKEIGSNKTYASYATEIKWYLGLAYLKAGKLDSAKSMFKEVEDAGNEAYSGPAKEIVDKINAAD